MKMRMNPYKHVGISTNIWIATLTELQIWFLSSALKVYFYFHFQTSDFSSTEDNFQFHQYDNVCLFFLESQS